MGSNEVIWGYLKRKWKLLQWEISRFYSGILTLNAVNPMNDINSRTP